MKATTKDDLKASIFEENNVFSMAVYSYLQYIGFKYGDEGFKMLRKIHEAGKDGIRIDSPSTGMRQELELLGKIGMVQVSVDKIKFDMDAFLTNVGRHLEIDNGEHSLAIRKTRDLVDKLVPEIPYNNNLAPNRRDGIGLNRDFIFNKLRGYLRNTETRSFKSSMLKWLV